MPAGRLTTRVAVTGLALSASMGMAAPAAHAFVCSKVPAQCQAILDELRKYPGVCESIPNTQETGPYSWNEAAFCDDPDAWSRYLAQGIVSNVCPEARCDRLIENTIQQVLKCLSDGIRCQMDGG